MVNNLGIANIYRRDDDDGHGLDEKDNESEVEEAEEDDAFTFEASVEEGYNKIHLYKNVILSFLWFCTVHGLS